MIETLSANIYCTLLIVVFVVLHASDSFRREWSTFLFPTKLLLASVFRMSFFASFCSVFPCSGFEVLLTLNTAARMGLFLLQDGLTADDVGVGQWLLAASLTALGEVTSLRLLVFLVI